MLVSGREKHTTKRQIEREIRKKHLRLPSEALGFLETIISNTTPMARIEWESKGRTLRIHPGFRIFTYSRSTLWGLVYIPTRMVHLQGKCR